MPKTLPESWRAHATTGPAESLRPFVSMTLAMAVCVGAVVPASPFFWLALATGVGALAWSQWFARRAPVRVGARAVHVGDRAVPFEAIERLERGALRGLVMHLRGGEKLNVPVDEPAQLSAALELAQGKRIGSERPKQTYFPLAPPTVRLVTAMVVLAQVPGVTFGLSFGPNLALTMVSGLILAAAYSGWVAKRRPSLRVGPEGVSIRRLFGKERFVRYDELEGVELGKRDTVRLFTSAETLSVSPGGATSAKAVTDAIETERRAFDARAPVPRMGLEPPDGLGAEELASWAVEPSRAAHRLPATTPDQLVDLVADPTASPAVRIRAAASLVGGSPTVRARVASAVAEAEPRLREAVEHALEGNLTPELVGAADKERGDRRA